MEATEGDDKDKYLYMRTKESWILLGKGSLLLLQAHVHSSREGKDKEWTC